jgi:N4-gp56 family major capsid protein
MNQGKQAAETFDSLTRDELVTGSNIYYGGDATSRVTLAAGDIITTTLLDKAILGLKLNDAPKITKMVNPSTFIGTQSVREAYVCIVHPTIGQTIQGLTGFIDVKDYGSTMTAMSEEIGAYKDIRFIESTNAKIFEDAGVSNEDVYPLLVLGQEAYGRTQVSGEELKTVRKASVDALDQRNTIGWKGTFVGKILDNRALYRIEVTAS